MDRFTHSLQLPEEIEAIYSGDLLSFDTEYSTLMTELEDVIDLRDNYTKNGGVLSAVEQIRLSSIVDSESILQYSEDWKVGLEESESGVLAKIKEFFKKIFDWFKNLFSSDKDKETEEKLNKMLERIKTIREELAGKVGGTEEKKITLKFKSGFACSEDIMQQLQEYFDSGNDAEDAKLVGLLREAIDAGKQGEDISGKISAIKEHEHYKKIEEKSKVFNKFKNEEVEVTCVSNDGKALVLQGTGNAVMYGHFDKLVAIYEKRVANYNNLRTMKTTMSAAMTSANSTVNSSAGEDAVKKAKATMSAVGTLRSIAKGVYAMDIKLGSVLGQAIMPIKGQLAKEKRDKKKEEGKNNEADNKQQDTSAGKPANNNRNRGKRGRRK